MSSNNILTHKPPNRIEAFVVVVGSVFFFIIIMHVFTHTHNAFVFISFIFLFIFFVCPFHKKKCTFKYSRSPTSPSWTEEQIGGGGSISSATTSQMQKSAASATTSNYMDGSDTRSISNDTMMMDHHNGGGGGSSGQVIIGGTGGKLGYNNNQYLSQGHASDMMLGHSDDISSKHLSTGSIQDSKSDQLDYDQDGNTETETKSVSSIKSGGSNPDARYFFFLTLYHIIKTLNYE